MSISNCPCNKCTAASFPFFSVGNFEYKMLSSCSFLTNSNDSCVRYDDNYFSTTKLSELTSTLKNDDFYVVHFNARSLSKNLNKIEEFLCDMSRFPDVVAISETKLNTNSTSNINISNYSFFRKDSHSCAGGVGPYVKNTMQFQMHDDLSLNLPNCEDLWLQIKCKSSDIVLGVIYRHPNKGILSFQNTLYDTLANLETKKLNYVICGDININTLNRNNTKILDYTNAIVSLGCEMTIGNPTRFSENCNPSLLDHIYTNITKKSTYSRISAFEISDHLPIFF